MPSPKFQTVGLPWNERMKYPEYHLWDECLKYAKSRNRSWVTTLYKRSLAGAAARKIPFKLTLEDVFSLLERCKGRCELTGTELRDRKIDIARIGWIKPSIDRINSRGIYEFSNTRIVCVAANMALGEWGEEVFAYLAKGYCDRVGIRHIRTGTLRNQLDSDLWTILNRDIPEKIKLDSPQFSDSPPPSHN